MLNSCTDADLSSVLSNFAKPAFSMRSVTTTGLSRLVMRAAAKPYSRLSVSLDPQTNTAVASPSASRAASCSAGARRSPSYAISSAASAIDG